MILKSDEKLEDLKRDNLFIIQSKSKYRFSVDSVNLSTFAKVKNNDNVVELCSGSGVVSILIQAKYQPKTILGIEIDSELCDMSIRSLEYNKIKNIKFINDDIKNWEKYIKKRSVDIVVCNPPYYKLKDIGSQDKDLVARYETKTKIEEVLSISSKMLKDKGVLYLSFPSKRIQELLALSYSQGLICKEIEMALNKDNKASFILVKFVKNAKEDASLFATFT